LVLSFLTIALITGIVGTIGINRLIAGNYEFSKLYEGYGKASGELTDVEINFAQVRLVSNEFLYSANTGEINEKFFKKYDTQIDTHLDNYEKILGDKNQTKKLRSLFADYRSIREDVARLFLQNKTNEAKELVKSRIVPISQSIDDELSLIINKKAEEGTNISAELTKQGNRTAVMMIIVVALSVIIALVLGFLLNKLIAKPINKIVEAAEDLAVGKVNIDMATPQRDEIGKLMNAFNKMAGTIKGLIAETNMLSQNAVNGNLEIRGDADKFKGDYKSIIKGMNVTMDAIESPINDIFRVMDQVSNGNLAVNVNGNYKGIYNKLASSINNTIVDLRSIIDIISYSLEEISHGDLNLKEISAFKGDFVNISNSLNTIVNTLNEIMGDINSAADQVATGAWQVSDASQALSQGASEQTSFVQQLMTSISEISVQTKQNALNANLANELANKVKDQATLGNSQMKLMLESMAGINESSSNISKIIKVIDEIAFQTNILALNAAVEAARAGQNGKGFAVVAEEVRNLAARSSKAAKETTALIEGSIRKVESGTKIAKDTADALSDIVTGIDRAVKVVGEITDASIQQASAIAQINTGIDQVSSIVQTNSGTAQESAAASEELSGQAEFLKEMISNIKLREIKAFKKTPSILLPVKEQNEKSKNKIDLGKY
jgi:methyl-accepting chemotaxis protein